MTDTDIDKKSHSHDDDDDDNDNDLHLKKRARSSALSPVPFDLSAIAAVPGLFLCLNVLDVAGERALLALVDANSWSDVLKRRVQHYGFQYDYKSRNLAPAAAPPIPDLCLELATNLRTKCGLPSTTPMERQFDQLIVNEYVPGQGISAHTDASVFGACIVSVSLNSGVIMRFSRANHASVDVWLPPRSAVFLTGDARRLWKHAIAAVKSDKGHGARSRRVSLTFRTLLSLDNQNRKQEQEPATSD
jgi:alkylated DNA repair dioxygenase AlkB